METEDASPKDQRMVTKQELDESLERVMNKVLAEIDLRFSRLDKRFDRIDARFDRIEARLDRQGASALLRFDRWADSSDQRVSDL